MIAMNMKPNQQIAINGITATLNEFGEIEINDPAFILQLLALGFREGRNNSPEDLDRILANIPPEYWEAFMDGCNAKS